MKKYDLVITNEIRMEYERFLDGQTSYNEIEKKYGLSHYKLTKIFDVLYKEKRNILSVKC